MNLVIVAMAAETSPKGDPIGLADPQPRVAADLLAIGPTTTAQRQDVLDVERRRTRSGEVSPDAEPEKSMGMVPTMASLRPRSSGVTRSREPSRRRLLHRKGGSPRRSGSGTTMSLKQRDAQPPHHRPAESAHPSPAT
jgi:hypothetical protein